MRVVNDQRGLAEGSLLLARQGTGRGFPNLHRDKSLLTVFCLIYIIVKDIAPVLGFISSYIADSLSCSAEIYATHKGLESDIRKENTMNRKTTFPIALMLFVLLWGAFGFVAGPSQAQTAAFQTTPVVSTPAVGVTVVAPVVTQLVPVTGTTDPSPMMWIFFGLIALLGVVFLVALLAGSGAHRHDGPPPPP